MHNHRQIHTRLDSLLSHPIVPSTLHVATTCSPSILISSNRKRTLLKKKRETAVEQRKKQTISSHSQRTHVRTRSLERSIAHASLGCSPVSLSLFCSTSFASFFFASIIPYYNSVSRMIEERTCVRPAHRADIISDCRLCRWMRVCIYVCAL